MKDKILWILSGLVVGALAATLVLTIGTGNGPAQGSTPPAQMENPTPSGTQDQTPDATAGTNPGSAGETKPGTAGETKPGTTDETKPGTTGETTPGTATPTEPDVGPTAPPPPQQSGLAGLSTITFRSGEAIISAQKLAVGAVPEVPAMASSNDKLVFAGWDKAITAVEGDTEYKAVYEDISGKSNVFVLDTVYTNDPKNVKLALSLRGDVNICVADLQIHYDPNQIQIDEVLNVDSSIQYNILPEEGRIKISLLQTQNLKNFVDCFQLRVSLVGSTQVAQLDITVEDAAYLSGDSKLTDAQTQSISGKILCVQ